LWRVSSIVPTQTSREWAIGIFRSSRTIGAVRRSTSISRPPDPTVTQDQILVDVGPPQACQPPKYVIKIKPTKAIAPIMPAMPSAQILNPFSCEMPLCLLPQVPLNVEIATATRAFVAGNDEARIPVSLSSSGGFSQRD
jgi:hypothetical protein